MAVPTWRILPYLMGYSRCPVLIESSREIIVARSANFPGNVEITEMGVERCASVLLVLRVGCPSNCQAKGGEIGSGKRKHHVPVKKA